MAIQKDIEELLKINEEIKKQRRMLTVRRILLIVLIGFLIGRDAQKKLSQNEKKKEELRQSVEAYFRNLRFLISRLEELKNVEAFAARLEEKKCVDTLLSYRMDFRFFATEGPREAVSSMDRSGANYSQIIEDCLKSYLHQNARISEGIVKTIENSNTYLIHAEKEYARKVLGGFAEDLEYFISKNVLTELCRNHQVKTREYLQTVSEYNGEFISKRKKEFAHLFCKGELEFDEEQKTAIITDDKHNLVVAGAGSGKTEALITRIAYLIKRKPDAVPADRILAIAYQRKDVKQILDRLAKDYGIEDIEVSTFHKLGKNILQNAGIRIERNALVDENKKSEVVRTLYNERLKEPNFYSLLLQYAKTLHDEESDEAENKSETVMYAESRPYFSINNLRVKSRAEKEIIDFFLMNNLNGLPIDVVYEPDLEGFRPDFYLPRFDIFIEHWALNEKGEVPNWFSQTSEEYKQEMHAKKEWFATHNKLLVETFAYEYDSSNPEPFIEMLKKRLLEKIEANNAQYEFTSIPYEKLVGIAWGPYREPVEEIINYITIAKTYGLSFKRIVEKLAQGKWSDKQLALGKLAVRIFEDYGNLLAANNKIDFEDMINEAISELEKNPILQANRYDQILIDEYQDISAQRYRLIKKIMEQNPKSKLFCVGDDWQSIMGFSGSNLDFFVNFSKYFENPAITKISMNYRSVKTIVDAGAQLIKNNGSCQIPKTQRANWDDERLIHVLCSPHKTNYRTRYFEDTSEDCLVRVNKYLKDGTLPKDILILTRFMRTRVNRGYKFHQAVKILKERADEMGIDLIFDDARDQSKVRVLTVHKSKGLEAKVVFILNVIKDTYGFPCEMEDSSIYAPARENYPKQKSIEEERRLFYVAMTRARENLIIYTWEQAISEFLHEIENFAREERLNY